MDGRHFDDLARALAAGASRRNVLKGLTGSAGAALAGALSWRPSFGKGGALRQGCAELGARCLRDDACCSGLCDVESRRCVCTDDQEECDDECVDLRSDPANCGECGESCSAGQRCLDGACCSGSGGTCDGDDECCGGLTCCDGRCTDPSGDPNNCGDCGETCDFDPYLCEAPTCQDGVCGRRPVPDGTLCVPDDPSYACCDGGCADLHREEHCGECGNICAPEETCCRGEGCFDLAGDPEHCGGCFHACDPGESCVAGECCPGPGTTCSSDEECCGGDLCCGNRCVSASSDPRNCGGCDVMCSMGQICQNGSCGMPGGAGGTGGTGGTGQGAPPTGMGAPVGGACGNGVTCGPGAGCCSGVCRDFSSDTSHCGGCSRPCLPGQVCTGGVCMSTMPGGGPPDSGEPPDGGPSDGLPAPSSCGSGPACGQGRSCCDDVCVDISSSPTNCGGCGMACGAGQTCCNGGCFGVMSCPPDAPPDLTTCSCRCEDGRPPCGSSCCGMGQTCVDGTCSSLDAAGECETIDDCDEGTDCCEGSCVDTTTDRQNCGACGATCAEGTECCDGRCVSLLTGANCGACGNMCPPGACCRNGECVCSGGNPPCDGECPDYSRDPENCGVCGLTCEEDETCRLGECHPTGDSCNDDDDCPDGSVCCDETCYDVSSDPTRCGSCDGACLFDPGSCTVPTCEDGTCGSTPATDGSECDEDDPYYRCCGGACVNTATAPSHCGACGFSCAPGETCCGGEGCFDLQTDPANCGECGFACEMGETCVGGACQPFGGAGTGCTADEECSDGLTCCLTDTAGVCRDLTSDEEHCGECGQVCANAGPPCQGVRSSSGATGTWAAQDRPACAPDEAYFLCCDSSCADVLSDPSNCGDCGLTCGEGQECLGGYCTGPCESDDDCSSDQSCCGGECVDPRSDPRYCGDCATACTEGELCCAGACTTIDEFDCGVCDYTCPAEYPICEPRDSNPTGYHCCTEAGTSCNPQQPDPCCGESACLAVAPETYACCLPDGEGCEAACGPEQLCPPCCTGYCGSDGTCAPNPDLCEDGRPLCGDACCTPGTTCCDGTCLDTTTDPMYCGACDNACPEEMGCYQGACCHFESQACEEADSLFGCCEGLTCQDGLCAPTTAECEDGNDCPEGWGCCEDVCYDLFTDPNHCGECNVVCEPGTTCVDRVCQPTEECVETDQPCPDDCLVGERCDQCCGGYCGGNEVCYPCGPGNTCETTEECCDGLTCCAGTCVDLANDPAHCSECENACDEPADAFECQRTVCRVGVCGYDVAPDGTTCVEGDEAFACCGGECTLLPENPEHCGACGVTCDPGYVCCQADGCYDLMNDPGRCGFCDRLCPEGMGCYQGECCYYEGETCDAANGGAPCCSGYVCDGGTCVPDTAACEEPPPPCVEGPECPSGFCVDGYCRRVCTGAPDACCPNEHCWDITYQVQTLSGEETPRPLALCLPACESDENCEPGYVCCPSYCANTPDEEGQPGECAVCVDPQRNEYHCGQCGTYCPDACIEGLCWDRDNCAPPGESCTARADCCRGESTAVWDCQESTGTCCLGPNNMCSSDAECCAGEGTAGCVDGRCCSYGDGPCVETANCCDGFACVIEDGETSGTCQPAETGCQTDDDCGTDLLCCEELCVDPQTDPSYCGSCEVNCTDEGMGCYQGQCCHFESEACFIANAGAGCCEGLLCYDGACVPTDDVCEAALRTCESQNDCVVGWEDCVDAYCRRLCTGLPDNCCADEECVEGVCQSGGGQPCEGDPDCTDEEFCCDGTCCPETRNCIDGHCCVAANRECAVADDCCDGFPCVDGLCQPPLNGGLPCTDDAECPPDYFCCEEVCVDPETDPNHCGACGAACPEGLSCEPDGCCHVEGDPCGAANLGFPCCAGYACVEDICQPEDGVTDPCALVLCNPDTICCNGECYDPLTDPTHCGGCDVACSEGVPCQGGVCGDEDGCLLDAPCEESADCCLGYACDSDSGTCYDLRDECPPDAEICDHHCCIGGYVCDGDDCCIPPGDTGNVCSTDDDCCGGALCEEGLCRTGDGCLPPGGDCGTGLDVICCPGDVSGQSACEVDVCCVYTGDACTTGNNEECCGDLVLCEDGRCCAVTCATCSGDDDCCFGHYCDGQYCQPNDGQVACGLCEADGDCLEGYTCCYGICTVLSDDPNNCDGCGIRCPAAECNGATCANGVCGLIPFQDGELCTAGGCLPNGACQGGVCVDDEPQPNGTLCYDGNPCQTTGVCEDGRCVQEPVPDGEPCETTNTCLIDGTCTGGYCAGTYAPYGSACGADTCWEDGACDSGRCTGGRRLDNGSSCDDGNACTTNDACVDGLCRGEPVVCDGNLGYCDPSQGGCVAGEIADGTPCADGASFYCSEVCCEPSHLYDACAGGRCCYADSASPDGQVCCDVGDPAAGVGVAEYWVEGYGCCRVHLACGNVCCPGLLGEPDQYCYEGQCREANQPCNSTDECAGDEVCIDTLEDPEVALCCPGWRACGDVCCAQDQHCEDGACAPGYPRILRTGP
jgi:hypothetical protein